MLATLKMFMMIAVSVARAQKISYLLPVKHLANWTTEQMTLVFIVHQCSNYRRMRDSPTAVVDPHTASKSRRFRRLGVVPHYFFLSSTTVAHMHIMCWILQTFLSSQILTRSTSPTLPHPRVQFIHSFISP